MLEEVVITLSDEILVRVYDGKELSFELTQQGPQGPQGKTGTVTPQLQQLLADTESARDVAVDAKNTADKAADDAVAARDGSQQARADAEAARDAAQSSANSAANLAADADAARDEAVAAKSAALLAEAGAIGAKDDAADSALLASEKADEAAQSAIDAAGFASSAEEASNNAADDASASEVARAAAEGFAITADEAATASTTAKDAAEAAAEASAADASAADLSKQGADIAADAAITARQSAQAAQLAAVEARDAAIDARDGSISARQASEQARAGAEGAQSAAAGSAGAAEQSAIDAAAYAAAAALFDPSKYPTKDNNGSDFTDTDAVRLNIGAHPLMEEPSNEEADTGTEVTPRAWSAAKILRLVAAHAADSDIQVDDVVGLADRLAELALAGHLHQIADVDGLADILAGLAPLSSPGLTGTPTAPTPNGVDNSTRIATTAFVQAKLAELVASAPGLLDTLAEIAAALGDDPEFATTVMTLLSEKAPLVSPAFTGTPTAPTVAAGDASQQIATTEFVQGEIAPVAAANLMPLRPKPAMGIGPDTLLENGVYEFDVNNVSNDSGTIELGFPLPIPPVLIGRLEVYRAGASVKQEYFARVRHFVRYSSDSGETWAMDWVETPSTLGTGTMLATDQTVRTWSPAALNDLINAFTGHLVRKDQNLADLPDKAAARANVGVLISLPLPDANADTCFAEGSYVTSDTWVGSPLAGTSGSNQGYLRVQRWNSDAYVLQEFTSINSTFLKFARRRENGVWGAWRSLPIGAQTVSAAAPSGGADGDVWYQV